MRNGVGSRTLAGVTSTLAVFAFAGCAADEVSPPIPAPETSLPTPQELSATLTKFYDWRLPQAERGDNVEGQDHDPEPLDPHGRVPGQDPVITFDVTDVEQSGANRIVVTATTIVNGRGLAAGQVPFVRDANKWKIEKAYVCALFATAVRVEPSCT